MATSAPTLLQDRVRARTDVRLLGLWHLCSLDAPTVALVWTAFVGVAFRVVIPWTTLAAMWLAVWMLYGADRLLDACAEQGDLEARHHFHHQHRRAFTAGLAVAGLGLAPLLATIAWAAMRLYLIEGALLMVWFALIHGARGVRLPKELAVGPFFAAAVFIPTVARVPELGAGLAIPAALLAAVCSLNCLFLYAWEHPEMAPDEAHPTTRWAVRYLLWIAGMVGCGALALTRANGSIGMACALAVCALMVLHGCRHRMTALTLRALADVALLTPLLLMGWIR